MPTMIKFTRDRAEIKPGFRDRIKPLLKLCFAKIQSDVNHAPSYNRKALENARAPVLKSLAIACTYPDALDSIYTRLRALPYTSYDIAMVEGVERVVLHTRPIIGVTQARGREREQKFDMGEYIIYVTPKDFANGVLENIHMIPQNDPLIRARHMHHHLGYRTHPGTYEPMRYAEDLFTENPHTCWGEFPNLVMGVMSDGDLVELARILSVFLSRLNTHSPLERIAKLTFMKEIA